MGFTILLLASYLFVASAVGLKYHDSVKGNVRIIGNKLHTASNQLAATNEDIPNAKRADKTQELGDADKRKDISVELLSKRVENKEFDDLFDARFDDRFEELFGGLFNKHFDGQFNKRFDERFEWRFNERFDKRLKERFNQFFNERYRKRFSKRFSEQLKEKSGEHFGEIGKDNREIQAHPKPTATVYVRWGRTFCPNGTDTVYQGQIAGSSYRSRGGAGNNFCTPLDTWGDPSQDWDFSTRPFNPVTAGLWGAKYDTDDVTPYKDKHIMDAMCAVCEAKNKSMSLVIPGKVSCPGDWDKEYSGYLMIDHEEYPTASEYLCVDQVLEVRPGSKKFYGGRLLNFVHAQCGSLQCPPMKPEIAVACVVCTK